MRGTRWKIEMLPHNSQGNNNAIKRIKKTLNDTDIRCKISQLKIVSMFLTINLLLTLLIAMYISLKQFRTIIGLSAAAQRWRCGARLRDIYFSKPAPIAAQKKGSFLIHKTINRKHTWFPRNTTVFYWIITIFVDSILGQHITLWKIFPNYFPPS